MHARIPTAAIAFLVALILVFPVGSLARAATNSTYSDEVGGGGVSPRLATSLLNSAWKSSVVANGGTPQLPIILPSGTITSLPVASDGTTTSVTRTRYTLGPSPVYVEASTNQGTGSCVANGGTAGAGLQDGAPRPTSLIGGSAFCPNGFAYSEDGGTGESDTRDAVEFAFSRPVLGFGAWFGDLETRTDGQGVAAVVRLYGVGNVLLSDQIVTPGPTYLPQSSCGGTYIGCGNRTTRWVGFVADPALPVIRMVVIVGDDDTGGDGAREGISFIGPTFDLSTASISLVKSATPPTDTNLDGLIGAGDNLPYSFLVTNTGTLDVSSVSITDSGAIGVSCPPGTLTTGETTTCTGSHIVTQTETNTGLVTNTATATADVYGGTITSDSSSHTAVIPRVAGLTISKVVDLPTYATVGAVLSYDTTVTNQGNVTITGVSVTDLAPGSGVFSTDCAAVNATMQPKDSVTCLASYTVTQADVDAGSVSNTASTTGTTPSGLTIGPFSDTATSAALQSVSLNITKSVSEPTFETVGQLLHYTITVFNGGNVTLHQLTVLDTAPGTGLFSSTCSGLPSSLAPGAEATCSAEYAVTQDDLDAGQITNAVNATALDPAGVTIDSPQDTATSTAVVVGGLGITKSVAEAMFSSVGDVLHFTVTVTNHGTVTATSLVVTDVNPGSGAFSTTCGSVAPTLAPSTSVQCTASYTVTQADLDAGSVVNKATAEGIQAGNLILSPTAQAESTALVIQSLTLSKTPNVGSYSAVGEVIVYTLTLANSGNVTLASPLITDTSPGAGGFTIDCGTVVGPITPGGSESCSASYTVTQADIDAGSITNTAHATAVAPNGDIIAAPPAIADSPANQTVSLVLTKSVAETNFNAVGDELHYSLTLTNGGNTTLTAVTFTDVAPGLGSYVDNCASVSATLAPGGSVSCSATYTAAQSDLDAGDVTNSAFGNAIDPSNNSRQSNNASATSRAVQIEKFDLVKTAAESSYHRIGEVLHFTITLTNTGNVSFTSTTVSDSSPGVGAFTTDCATVAIVLAPGSSRICYAAYTISADDLSVNSSTNIASASAVTAAGDLVGVNFAEASVTRGSPLLSMTGTSVATLAVFALALVLAGIMVMFGRRKWRRTGDSNPRGLAQNTLSRRAP